MAQQREKTEDDEWNIDFSHHKPQPGSLIHDQMMGGKRSDSLNKSKRVNGSGKSIPNNPPKEKYFQINNSKESIKNLDVKKTTTLSELDWLDNEDKTLTNNQTPKNPQELKKGLQNQGIDLFTKSKNSKV